MSGFLWRMGGALAAGVLGLGLVFWQLEHAALWAFAGNGRPAFGVYALLFTGLVISGAALIFAFTHWARFLREHPDTRQVPVWFLTLLFVGAGAAFVTGVAVHAGYLRSLDQVPLEISEGFVLYQVSFATLALIPLVLLAARWSPGYHRQ